MPCTVPRFAGSLSAVVLAGVCVCLTAGEGLAAKVKPLGIASFALQTTQSREVAHGPGIAGYGFVNEPYPFTQAGGHPDGLTGTLQFTTEEVSPGTLTPTRDQKDMVIVLPPGVSADPQASAQCRATRALAPTACSPDTQVGVFVLRPCCSRPDRQRDPRSRSIGGVRA